MEKPLDDILLVPQPTVLKKAVEILVTNDVLTEAQILQELSNNNLSIDREEVELLLNLEKDRLLPKEVSSEVLSIRKNNEELRKYK